MERDVTGFAKALGVDERTLRRWLSGDTPIPPDYRARIDAALAAQSSREPETPPRPGAYVCAVEIGSLADKQVAGLLGVLRGLTPQALVARTLKNAGTVSTLARFCNVNERTVRRWAEGGVNEDLAARMALLEACLCAAFLRLALSLLDDVNVLARLGATPEGAKAVRADLNALRTGAQTWPDDLLPALRRLLVSAG